MELHDAGPGRPGPPRKGGLAGRPDNKRASIHFPRDSS